LIANLQKELAGRFHHQERVASLDFVHMVNRSSMRSHN
jgi:hypothetical protein